MYASGCCDRGGVSLMKDIQYKNVASILPLKTVSRYHYSGLSSNLKEGQTEQSDLVTSFDVYASAIMSVKVSFQSIDAKA